MQLQFQDSEPPEISGLQLLQPPSPSFGSDLHWSSTWRCFFVRLKFHNLVLQNALLFVIVKDDLPSCNPRPLASHHSSTVGIFLSAPCHQTFFVCLLPAFQSECILRGLW